MFFVKSDKLYLTQCNSIQPNPTHKLVQLLSDFELENL